MRWALEKQEAPEVPEPPKKRKQLFQNYPLRKRRKVESSDSEDENVASLESKSKDETKMEISEDVIEDAPKGQLGFASSFLYQVPIVK